MELSPNYILFVTPVQFPLVPTVYSRWFEQNKLLSYAAVEEMDFYKLMLNIIATQWHSLDLHFDGVVALYRW